ncbi:hypothetical protein N7G274_006897 [Stereocaulon virgatum]|uniref:Uncharacterized protein n=1 Tax=Stereocaulon virgatum TaxID=373712 RepID=A0ABR4A3F0_9LECA
MPSFDPTPSPRASKRRKTNPTSTPNESIESPLPFHSRVLKSVKQAIYGKSTSPKIGFEFGDAEGKAEGDITPGQQEDGGNTTRGRGIGGGRGDRASTGLPVNAELRKGSGRKKRVDADVDECGENEQRSPGKRRRGGKEEGGEM